MEAVIVKKFDKRDVGVKIHVSSSVGKVLEARGVIEVIEVEIVNEVVKNENEDLKIEISKLRAELETAKAELETAKAGVSAKEVDDLLGEVEEKVINHKTKSK